VPLDWPYAFGFGLAIGALGGFSFSALQRGTNLAGPGNWWSLFGIYLTILHALLFTSNSFTIWEDRALHYLLATFGVAMFLNSFRLPDTNTKLLSAWHSITFLVLSKLSTYSRLCREEQGETCVTTFYQEGSSVSPPHALYGFAVATLALPQIIKSFYKSSASYRGSATLWIGIGLQICMLVTLLYWVLDGAETYGWTFVDVSSSTLRTVKLVVARTILGATLVAANYGWYLGTLCVSINTTKTGTAIMGYSNMYGSTYFLFIVNIFAAALVVTKPVGGIALSIMVYQMLTLLELIDLHNLKYSILGPVVLGLLGSSYFFSTGHHATLPSIQWEIGFVPAATITFPITHLAIFLNTFAPSILATLMVPLAVLWKIPPSVKPKAVITRITRSLLGIAFYQALVTFSTMIWAAYFRRHLMIWKIFSPRYMLGGVSLLVVDVFVVVALAVGGQTVTYITGIFS
jgi:phosphatidylinositol glycan class O